MVSLLHVLDVTDFIVRAIDEEYTPEALVINLTSNPMRYSELAQQLQIHHPNVLFHFSDEDEVETRPVKVSAARTIYDWADTHTLENELEGLITLIQNDTALTKPIVSGIRGKLPVYPVLLQSIELIGGAVLVQLLSQMTGTLIQFKYIDFRLLFVVIMGTVYGIRTGLYAATLVSLSILYAWVQLGFDWALLIYNVGNWLPFALYFMAGLITGYNHDKNQNDILNARKQANLIYDKYSFLYGVFTDVRNLKDEFRERLLGYRDSFGKIFTITRELDHLQEHAVYLRALSILEEHMSNTNIAIYSLGGDRTYARLEASSVSLHGRLTRSMKLSDFPEMLNHVEQGTIFQNTALVPNYPAYMVPIFNNTYPFNVPAAMVVIWSVKFEQYSTYYYNLLKVICGLIQASLVRATQFSNANYERMYLPATRVLNHQAFMEALKVRIEMRKNRVSDFQLVVTQPANNLQDLYSCLAEGVRTTDLIGQGEDGDFYILLSQADTPAAQDVVERLAKLGLQSKIVDINHLSIN
jgi:UDP-glucose 4-epimerase